MNQRNQCSNRRKEAQSLSCDGGTAEPSLSMGRQVARLSKVETAVTARPTSTLESRATSLAAMHVQKLEAETTHEQRWRIITELRNSVIVLSTRLTTPIRKRKLVDICEPHWNNIAELANSAMLFTSGLCSQCAATTMNRLLKTAASDACATANDPAWPRVRMRRDEQRSFLVTAQTEKQRREHAICTTPSTTTSVVFRASRTMPQEHDTIVSHFGCRGLRGWNATHEARQAHMDNTLKRELQRLPSLEFTLQRARQQSVGQTLLSGWRCQGPAVSNRRSLLFRPDKSVSPASEVEGVNS